MLMENKALNVLNVILIIINMIFACLLAYFSSKIVLFLLIILAFTNIYVFSVLKDNMYDKRRFIYTTFFANVILFVMFGIYVYYNAKYNVFNNVTMLENIIVVYDIVYVILIVWFFLLIKKDKKKIKTSK